MVKRLVLLGLFAGALLALVPSQAACVSGLPGGAFACAEPEGKHEACVWGAVGVASTYAENCVDTNSDAWSDAYVYGYGDQHYYDTWFDGGELFSETEVGPACLFAYFNLSTSERHLEPC